MLIRIKSYQDDEIADFMKDFENAKNLIYETELIGGDFIDQLTISSTEILHSMIGNCIRNDKT